MSLQRLPVFISAARNLNFTKAAQEQCISQTAVSQQIKLLEEELGYSLFVRGKRGVRLTPAGELFYRECEKLVEQYRAAAAQGKRLAQDDRLGLHIGYAGAYELWSIAGQIRRYRKLYPQAGLDFTLASNNRLIADLKSGLIDVAMMSGIGLKLDEAFASVVTLSDPCMVMIASSHPLASKHSLTRRDLRNIPIVVNRAQDNQSSAAQIARMYANMGLGDSKRIYADDIYSIALIISAELAFSIVPASIMRWRMEGVTLRPLQGFMATSHTLMVYLKDSPSPGIQALIELIKS